MAPITYASRLPRLSGARHEEWLLDDAIDDTFPASDPVSHGQPGSIVNMRYAAREHHATRPRLQRMNSAPWWLLLGSAALACALLLVRERRRRRMPR